MITHDSARPPAPPTDFRLAVPEGWERIALDPQRWPHRIDKLVNRGFRGTAGTPQLRMNVAERLCEQARAAHARGGVEMYLSMLSVDGIPLSAGLVVTLLPAPAGSADLERLGIAKGAAGEDVRMVELPLAGPALRTRYRRVPEADDPDGNTLPVTHVDFQVAVPDTEGHLLLSFSTPMEPLADALVKLFDSIAMTLQWTD
ncbi:hypothetical protein K7472_07555 [Streptomyces sp. PTM05]|uniref:Uncharacterized protein n=1 Tax=Streptantibioticus parmotrematis TaxID=2873249 RepID=A0ABS7QSD0_9ACTN|nr:hypothetical protein [Streptantibioticus parmotrematis]MBY8884699.1 hypothetical protein [Streptantibioticus parmotrematis]